MKTEHKKLVLKALNIYNFVALMVLAFLVGWLMTGCATSGPYASCALSPEATYTWEVPASNGSQEIKVKATAENLPTAGFGSTGWVATECKDETLTIHNDKWGDAVYTIQGTNADGSMIVRLDFHDGNYPGPNAAYIVFNVTED